MKPEDYPEQEPLSDFARPYHENVISRSLSLPGHEQSYGDNPYQGLVYYPAKEKNSDVIIMIHGGGWTSGYKEWMSFKAPPLNSLGISFASIGYRLAPEFLFPSGLEDCMSGVAWIYHNIGKLNGDPQRIFISGHSAGGHYASLMAVRDDWQEAYDLPIDVIRGCLPISGVFNFAEGSGLSMRPRFLGKAGNEIEASPIANIKNNPPPFLISYGNNDFPHLKRQAEEMEAALRSVNGDVTTLELKKCDHLGASLSCGDIDGPWVKPAVNWIQSH